MDKTLKINKTNLGLFFLLFPYFNPTGLKYIPALASVYDAIQLWKLCACLYIWFLYFRKNRVSKFFIWVFSFQGLMIATTLLNHAYDSKVITNMLIATSLVMITELCVRTCFDKYLNQLWKISALFVCINFILTIIFQKGMTFATLYKSTRNPLYFLGIDNALAGQLIPFVFLATLRKVLKATGNNLKDNLELIVSYAIALITIAIVGSATGVFIILVFIILSVYYSFAIKRRVPYKLISIIYGLFFIVIIIMQSNNLVVEFVSNLLGRSMTFTGRNILWERALSKILERPILGYGYTAGNIEVWGSMFSSHNMFLEIALQGGIFSLLLFIIITWLGIRKNAKKSVQVSNTIVLAIFGVLLKGLMEVTIPFFYYIMLALAYCTIPTFNGDSNNEEMKLD
ncbi:O-antigen ligase family protein [Mediterraneibacter faecis]|uniref:O-antigen ligase family protein n=1 Tax=Mediterraneibacter faecis TaxID=592978 RepID=UPI0032671928